MRKNQWVFGCASGSAILAAGSYFAAQGAISWSLAAAGLLILGLNLASLSARQTPAEHAAAGGRA